MNLARIKHVLIARLLGKHETNTVHLTSEFYRYVSSKYNGTRSGFTTPIKNYPLRTKTGSMGSSL